MPVGGVRIHGVAGRRPGALLEDQDVTGAQAQTIRCIVEQRGARRVPGQAATLVTPGIEAHLLVCGEQQRIVHHFEHRRALPASA